MLQSVGENVDILGIKMKNDQVFVEWNRVLNIIRQRVQRMIPTKCGLKFWKKRMCKSEHKYRMHRFHACLQKYVRDNLSMNIQYYCKPMVEALMPSMADCKSHNMILPSREDVVTIVCLSVVTDMPVIALEWSEIEDCEDEFPTPLSCPLLALL